MDFDPIVSFAGRARPGGSRVWSEVVFVVHGLADEPAVNLFPGKPAGHAPPARFPDDGVLQVLTHRRRIA
jgi:hypothetical protein